MKRRFISLVAAAALVGGVAAVSMPAVASAGTVGVKGDTQVQMYGFLRYEAGWAHQMEGTATSTNVPYESTDNGYHVNDKTQLATQTGRSRLGLSFKNEDANLTGGLEGDFSSGTFGLRVAFVKHNCNNFYVLIGKYFGLEEQNTFSQNWTGPAGFGLDNVNVADQVQVGTNLDLGGATLDLAVALENNPLSLVNTGVGLAVQRKTVPGVAAKAAVKVNTGFGNPARVYVFGTAMPVKIINATNDGDKSETPYVVGGGVSLPISMVTLQSQYYYAKGANGLAGLTGNAAPSSYYTTDGISIQKNKFDAYNIEAKIAPMPNLSVAAGYDYLKFKKDTSLIDGAGNDKAKYQTYFGNVVLNTTKYTTLVLEWDHVKHSADGNYDSQSGDQYWLSYTYNF